MKPWLFLLFLVFISVAGYKLSGYQHQLSESKADKARLNSVLSRSRATEASELKVIKPTPKLSLSTPPQEINETVVAGDDVSGESRWTADMESFLNTFFTLPHNSQQFALSSVKCTNDLCEVMGQHSGTQRDLFDLVEALENEPWWEFGVPMFSTEITQGEAVTISVSLRKEDGAFTAISVQ
ncbi:hypothetical protein D210916BOD24_29460 [Alteromonas sp. D210916BOD_24]|uniref:hypothetical protein n=1 Tax=Alteromonas sp. D210916BOD_24 TaxID=3157618 RepID=UPI00399D2016